VTRRTTARLFAALDPPERVRSELSMWARSARGGRVQMRLVEPEMLHVTLCFLGSRPIEEIEPLAGAISACAAPADRLGLGAPLWLPPRRPRTLSVEIHDPEGRLRALQGAVARSVARTVDWQPEHRRFRPHVTVARMREGAAPRDRELPATPSLTFAGEALALYRSWLSPAGATYEAVARVELDDSTHWVDAG
jgi:2'-5' RNA ligase